MVTKKHQWLIDQTHKSHEAIDKNLEKWLKSVEKSYNQIFDEILSEMKTELKKFKKGSVEYERLLVRYQTLAFDAQQRANELGFEVAKEMARKLESYDKLAYEHMNEVLQKATGRQRLPVFSIDFAAGFDYTEYSFQSSVWKSGIRLKDKLNDILTKGLARGWDIRRYTKELRKVTDFTIYEAKRIARTESARVSNEGNKTAMKEYGVTRVEWNSALEKRTCERCAALHGKKFKMGQEPPLPLHPHCRCVLVPVLEEINY